MTKPTVLIAEDKDFLAKVIKANFPKDVTTIITSDWNSTVDKVRDADAVIASMNIIGPGGESLLGAIKNLKGIPVVCLTSNMTSAVRIKLLKEGADDVVTKPFNPEELSLRLLRFLK